MRVLLDECVPKALGRSLAGHATRTVPQEGWSGKKNGELLGLMSAAGFEVLLTVDQGVRHQQNLRSIDVAILVMIAVSNDIDDLLPPDTKSISDLGFSATRRSCGSPHLNTQHLHRCPNPFSSDLLPFP